MIIKTIEQYLRYICIQPHNDKDIYFITFNNIYYYNVEYIDAVDSIRVADHLCNSIFCSIENLANSIRSGSIVLKLSQEFVTGLLY